MTTTDRTTPSMPATLLLPVPVTDPAPALRAVSDTGDTTDDTRPAARPKVDKRRAALERFAVSITALTVLGHLFLGFEQPFVTPIVAAPFAWGLEWLLETIESRLDDRAPGYSKATTRDRIGYFLPVHIAAMACSLLLYANAALLPILLAVSIAVVSKRVLRVRTPGGVRHVLNPSNTGIAVVLLLLPWVSLAPPYQFTTNVGQPFDWLVPIALLGFGTLLNGKLTGKLPLIAGWLVGYVVQALARDLFLGHSAATSLSAMTGTAFILYTNYMITDPGTTPFPWRRQVVFGASVAMVYGVLMSFDVAFAIIYALVLVCLVRGASIAVAGRLRRRRDGEAGAVAPVAGARA